MLKLYGTDHSPFVARVQMAARALGIALEVVAPPDGASSPAYRAIVATGMVPALVLEDGWVLPESESIVEYLTDRAGDGGALRPVDAADRARARLLARLADLYLAVPLRELFEQAKTATPGVEVLAATVPAIREALRIIDRYLDQGPYAVGERLSSADCALVPLVFFAARCDRLARAFDGAGIFHGAPRVGNYLDRVCVDPVADATLAAMAVAQARRAAERERTGTNSIR